MDDMEQEHQRQEDPEQQPVDEPREQAMAGGKRIALGVGVVVIAVLPLIFVGMRHAHTAQAAGRAGQQAALPTQADIAALEAAVRSNASAPNRVNLAQAYVAVGRPSMAENELKQALGSDPGSVAAWNDLCVAQVQLQELKDASDSCQRALAIDPNFQLAKNNLSWANVEIKAEMDALAKQETVAPPARDRDFYLAQGLHRMHLGNYDAAIDSWQKMLLMNTQDAVAANNIGTALMLKHQPQAAVPWFDKAVQWDPTLQIAKNNLSWAQSEEAAAKPQAGR
jgi:Tfp pilus assembly protein PilF